MINQRQPCSLRHALAGVAGAALRGTSVGSAASRANSTAGHCLNSSEQASRQNLLLDKAPCCACPGKAPAMAKGHHGGALPYQLHEHGACSDWSLHGGESDGRGMTWGWEERENDHRSSFDVRVREAGFHEELRIELVSDVALGISELAEREAIMASVDRITISRHLMECPDPDSTSGHAFSLRLY